MNFASDNWAGAAPAIIDAIALEARRIGNPYGESPTDKAVGERFNEIFEREVAVFFVGTGSAANALSLASANRPGGVVFCHNASHILEDECGAVEYLTGGGRLLGLAGRDGKLDPEELRGAIGRYDPAFVHAGQPMAVSITQSTETGGIYELEEIRAVSNVAKMRGLPLHMDGARFANGLVSLGVTPAEMTWKSGVALLSFGGTKNGCVGAEAVVIFEPGLAAQFPYIRKRAGQLFSKSRFIAAQFDAYFRDGLWLELARHSNAMAERLRDGLRASPRAREAWPTRANEVFAVVAKSDAARLRGLGAAFYDWPTAANLRLEADEILVRLVTSFATAAEELDRFTGELG